MERGLFIILLGLLVLSSLGFASAIEPEQGDVIMDVNFGYLSDKPSFDKFECSYEGESSESVRIIPYSKFWVTSEGQLGNYVGLGYNYNSGTDSCIQENERYHYSFKDLDFEEGDIDEDLGHFVNYFGSTYTNVFARNNFYRYMTIDGDIVPALNAKNHPRLELTPQRDISFSFLVKRKSTGLAGIFSKADENNPLPWGGWGMWFTETDNLRFIVNKDEVDVISGKAVIKPDNGWNHVVLTLDRDGNATIYVNGFVRGQSYIGDFKDSDWTNQYNFTVGSIVGGGKVFGEARELHLNGDIANFKIFEGSLDRSQIRSEACSYFLRQDLDKDSRIYLGETVSDSLLKLCGYRVEGDCNDNDPTAYRGNEEICFDLIDNDCDGGVDERCVSDDPVAKVKSNIQTWKYSDLGWRSVVSLYGGIESTEIYQENPYSEESEIEPRGPSRYLSDNYYSDSPINNIDRARIGAFAKSNSEYYNTYRSTGKRYYPGESVDLSSTEVYWSRDSNFVEVGGTHREEIVLVAELRVPESEQSSLPGRVSGKLYFDDGRTKDVTLRYLRNIAYIRPYRLVHKGVACFGSPTEGGRMCRAIYYLILRDSAEYEGVFRFEAEFPGAISVDSAKIKVFPEGTVEDNLFTGRIEEGDLVIDGLHSEDRFGLDIIYSPEKKVLKIYSLNGIKDTGTTDPWNRSNNVYVRSNEVSFENVLIYDDQDRKIEDFGEYLSYEGYEKREINGKHIYVRKILKEVCYGGPSAFRFEPDYVADERECYDRSQYRWTQGTLNGKHYFVSQEAIWISGDKIIRIVKFDQDKFWDGLQGREYEKATQARVDNEPYERSFFRVVGEYLEIHGSDIGEANFLESLGCSLTTDTDVEREVCEIL